MAMAAEISAVLFQYSFSWADVAARSGDGCWLCLDSWEEGGRTHSCVALGCGGFSGLFGLGHCGRWVGGRGERDGALFTRERS
jgi:hypothetical protein